MSVCFLGRGKRKHQKTQQSVSLAGADLLSLLVNDKSTENQTHESVFENDFTAGDRFQVVKRSPQGRRVVMTSLPNLSEKATVQLQITTAQGFQIADGAIAVGNHRHSPQVSHRKTVNFPRVSHNGTGSTPIAPLIVTAEKTAHYWRRKRFRFTCGYTKKLLGFPFYQDEAAFILSQFKGRRSPISITEFGRTAEQAVRQCGYSMGEAA